MVEKSDVLRKNFLDCDHVHVSPACSCTREGSMGMRWIVCAQSSHGRRSIAEIAYCAS